jgi:hypothetical protein
MYFNLEDESLEILVIEKEILNISKSRFRGTDDHWTLKNTINHVCSWRKIAIGKVESRIDGNEKDILNGKTVEKINNEFYKETKGYSKRETIRNIEMCKTKISLLYQKIKGKENSTEVAPFGFKGTVFEYLKGDLLYHPISHYLYFAIRNNEYALFLEIEKYIKKTRSAVYNDLGIIDIKEIIDPTMYKEVFSKGYEWQNDDLYNTIKDITA